MSVLSRNIAIFCYVLLTIIAPWIAMFAVYGANDGWSLIGLYSHLFWFPLLFGAVQFVFLLRLVLMLLKSSARNLLLRVGLPFSILAVIAGAYIQAVERPALFELKPEFIRAEIPGTNGKTLLQHLENPLDNDRLAFEKKLPANSWRIPATQRSVTEIAVGLSILFQIFVWSWTALAFCWAARLIAPRAGGATARRKIFISTMLWTLILSLPWFAMREAFETYRGQAYANLQVPNAVALLGIIFVLGSVFLAAATWHIVGERLNSVVGFISTIGITGLIIKGNWLQTVFPRTPSVSQFILMFLIVAFLLTILLTQIPEQERKQGRP